MLSRVAESVFWMGRYMERTNCFLRILHTNYIAMQDETNDNDWSLVLDKAMGYLTGGQRAKIKKDSRAVLRYVMLDFDNDASLINNITRSRENARAVQDHITKEMWHALNAFHLLIRENSIRDQLISGDPITALDALIKHGMYLYGTVDITMARGEAYNFLNIGKFIERSILITDVLIAKLKELDFNLEKSHEEDWRQILFTLSGHELYLKSSHVMMESAPVIEQVLYDSNFVHSLLYTLSRIERYFKRLFSESIPESYELLDYLIGKALNHLKYNNCDVNNGKSVHELMMQVQADLFEISRSFNKNYFGYR